MTPKYPKPKILLLDIPHACETALRDAGYNVSVGTFGSPYSVEPSETLSPVTLDTCELPGFEEQEILVVNTSRPTPTDAQRVDSPGDGVDAIWQSADEGIIDPRPCAMNTVRSSFDRILAYGGIAIVLVRDRYAVQYVKGSASTYRRFRTEEKFAASSWSFLTQLDALRSYHAIGNEIEVLPEACDFARCLKRGMRGATYYCTVEAQQPQDRHWLPLAKNKYGACIAGLLMNDERPVCLMVLPQMTELHEFLPELLGTWCARWRPKLFPFHEGRTWLHTDRYEVPQITHLKLEIDRIKQEADERAKRLESQIEELRSAHEDWYTLLNGTGDELVGAVIRSLEKLGFRKVIDVDVQARAEGNERNLREDIQIHDALPILIVDVKGITGCPEDAEATQSEKHALMRAKEFKGEVKALTIVNHERHLPPHDRNPNPYRPEIIGNAEQTGLGLMSTWDLFRLLRNKQTLGWPDDVVKSVFFRTGRIEPIPDHYVETGRIVHVWRDAFGIIPNQVIQAGRRLAIEVGDSFEEIVADSLQVDDNSVTAAPAKSNCGIACGGAGNRFKPGMKVFVVRQADPT